MLAYRQKVNWVQAAFMHILTRRFRLLQISSPKTQLWRDAHKTEHVLLIP